MDFFVNLVVSTFIWKSGIDFLTDRFYTAVALKNTLRLRKSNAVAAVKMKKFKGGKRSCWKS